MQLIDELNSIIDAIFMGQYFGSEAVASMSIVYPFILMILAIGAVFSSGTNVAIGRYLGSNDIKKANTVFMNRIITTIAIGLVFGIVGYFATPYTLSLFNITAKIKYFAEIYMRAISIGMPIILLTTLLNSLIYTEGHSKI